MRAGLFIASLTALIASLILIANQDFSNPDSNSVIYILLLFILFFQGVIGLIATYNDFVSFLKKLSRPQGYLLEKK